MASIYSVIYRRMTSTAVGIYGNAQGRGGQLGRPAARRRAFLAAGSLAVAMFAQAGPAGGKQPQSAALSPCTTAACEASSTASNQPNGGQVVSGKASIAQSGDTTVIHQSTPELTIDWLSFNIGSQDTVDFVQPSASAIAVNQIFSTNGSQILGHLDANGQVWLINPNGVMFGRGAEVNVGGLVASTLDVSDASLSSNTVSFSGTGTGGIVNQGAINAANGGYVALLGNQVSNEGAITARLGTVALGAGSTTTLTFSGASLVKMQVDQSTLHALAENGGLIQADGGTVNLSAGAKNALLASVVNNTGLIEARTVENHDGTIELLGGMTAGTVNVGGTLDASAPEGGSGGFIETDAAHVEVANDAKVTTLAASGKTGTWLIDPTDFTVAPSGGDMSGATLSSDLNTTNTTILSSNGVSPVTGDPLGQGGNINVNDIVSWSANTTLTLTAANNVNVNANITATGNTAGLVINPNTANGSEAASGTGAFNLNMGNSITLSGSNPSLSIAGNSYTVINSLGAAGSTTGTDLQGINGNLSGYYALGSNIDATSTSSWNSGAGFTPIGNSATNFTGSFNGLGHTISNLYINLPSTDFVGPFGAAGYGSVIQNVGLVSGSVSGNQEVGGLVALNAGTVVNSYATSSVSGSDFVGGLVGTSGNIGTITNSYATGSVSGSQAVGGLVGQNGGLVTNSYATGSVNSSQEFVGGLVGENEGAVSNSYATGNVSGSSYVGGLVGFNDGGTLNGSYATGSVSGGSGSESVGGLVGFNYAASITNSYATGSVSGSQIFIGGLVGLNYDAASITNSYATGNVSGASGSEDVGGLVGYNYYAASITNSYATGSVSGSSQVGGLVGLNYGGTVTNTYATGSVSGSSQVGGLVGENEGAVSNSFWDTTSSGQATSAGGTGLTDSQMQTASSFNGWSIATTGGSGDVWRIYEGNSYPLLISFLTPLTLTDAPDATVTYNGTTQSGGTTAISGALGAAATGTNAGFYNGYYSTQQGYDITGGNLTITPASLALSGTRVYDGTTIVAGSILTATGVDGQTFTVTGAGDSSNLASKNVQTDSTLASVDSYALGSSSNGGLASNYFPLSTMCSSITITPAALTISAVSDSKTYDGTTNSSQTPTVTGTIYSGDSLNTLTQSFASKNVLGTNGSTLDVNSYTLNDGNGGNNYTVTVDSATGTITPASLVINAVSQTKTYDGTTTAAAIPTVTGTVFSGDSLSPLSESYASKNVLGTNGSTLNVNSYTLNDGNGGNNYTVTVDSATGTITPLASVAWVGGATGNWSTASNWAGGIVPDLSNVLAVTIPKGKTVTYDSGVVGTTILTSLTDSGNLVLAAGDLSTTGNLSTVGFQQTGGTLDVGGKFSVKSTSGGVSLGDITAGTLSISSKAGAITQLASSTLDVTGASSLTAPTYAITLTNSSDIFGGAVSSSGSNIDLYQSTGGLKLGATTATGNFTADALAGAITQTAGVTVDGTTNLTANNAITLSNATNDFGGAVTANGSAITLGNSAVLTAFVDSTGATALISVGSLNLSGTVGTSLTTTTTGTNSATTFDANTAIGTALKVTSSGAITQLAATTLDVTGASSLTAPNNSITLANASNIFGGAVSSSGSNIDLYQSAGGLKLGATTATGNFAADASAGAITQTAGVTVGGTSTLTANKAITLANAANDLGGSVTATGSAITLDDAVALSASLDSTGASSLTSAGPLNISGTVGTSLTTTTTGTNSATTFGATTAGTKLVVTSTGAVTETSSNILTVDREGTTTVHNPHVTVNGRVGAEIQ